MTEPVTGRKHPNDGYSYEGCVCLDCEAIRERQRPKVCPYEPNRRWFVAQQRNSDCCCCIKAQFQPWHGSKCPHGTGR